MTKGMKNPFMAFLSVLAACTASGEAGEGTVTFSTYGEDYIEKEIPAADVADGWTIRYGKFLVAIGEVSVAEADRAPLSTMTGSKLFAMTRPGDKAVVTFSGVPAKAYPDVGYVIGPVTAATTVGEGASEADKDLMARAGYALYVEGSAQKASVTKTFAWGFTARTHYEKCKGALAGKETDGVVVTNGGTDRVELTIHGDHLFYDDLQSNEAKLRFDNLAAADADDDGAVTLEELAAVKLAALPAERGPYGTGSAAGIHDLGAFVAALSRTVGHFRGEGECVSRAEAP